MSGRKLLQVQSKSAEEKLDWLRQVHTSTDLHLHSQYSPLQALA